jgi:hypothetical protein
LTRRGGGVLEPVLAARWTVMRTAWQAIEAWRSKPGLAGLDVPPDVQDAILDKLARWARSACGDLHRQVTCEETYVLQGVDLSSTARRRG